MSLQEADPSDVTRSPALWEKVLRKVESGEMPPPDAPRPAAEARLAFAKALEASLDAAAAADPNPGAPPAHRLNRAEYANAVRDLLALDLNIGPMLPTDDSGYGFDNIADVLSLSPALLDRYLFVARRISRLAVGAGPIQPEKDIFVRNRETGFLDAGHNRGSRQDLPLGAGYGAAFRYYFPRDGEYVLAAALDQGDSRTAYESWEQRVAVRAGLRTLVFGFLGESSQAERPGPSAEPGVRPQPPLDIRLDGRRLARLALPDAATPYQLRRISVDGPYRQTGPGDTPSRRAIFSCRPTGPEDETPCAESILGRLARRAYRRPVDGADVGALLAVFEKGRAEGGFELGIQRALQALLVSPSFIFRVERDPEGAAPGSLHPVDDIALASRLSFFLWSSLPDDELLDLAEQGRLGAPGTLEGQIRRMLASPKARALTENFAGQWLELRKVSQAKPDEKLFPEFDGALRLAMRRETELFFEDILRRNRSVLDLLVADYTFLNERLAEHYGIPGVFGAQLRRVRLHDPRRGGLLGHGSVLTVTSYPNRTSVVIRGKWVLESLFGMPPPPPPPDIPELEEESGAGLQLSLRERMAQHGRSPTCASCHVRMDPIGFALENYDAIGRWRTHDGSAPIDATGELPGAVSFDGPRELRQALAAEFRQAFAATVVEKLLTYALGRGLEYYDRPTVRSIVRDTGPDEYRLGDLIVSVAQSMPFRMRRGNRQ